MHVHTEQLAVKWFDIKEVVIHTYTLSLCLAQDACHANNPGCASDNPNSTLSFFDCCVSEEGLLRQSSYGGGPGRSCIRCATLGTVELFFTSYIMHHNVHVHVHIHNSSEYWQWSLPLFDAISNVNVHVLTIVWASFCNHFQLVLPYILGCHEDKNCAAETGSEAANAHECCKQRNKRSYRNPYDGTCQRCSDGK